MIVDDYKLVVWGLECLVESVKLWMVVVGMVNFCVEMLVIVSVVNLDVILFDFDLNGQNVGDVLFDLQCLSQGQVLIFIGGCDFNIQYEVILKGVCGVIGKDESVEVLLYVIECVYVGEVWINCMMMGKVFGVFFVGGGKNVGVELEVGRIVSFIVCECDVVCVMVQNCGDKSLVIVRVLNISEYILCNYLIVIYDKFGVRNWFDLFVYVV